MVLPLGRFFLPLRHLRPLLLALLTAASLAGCWPSDIELDDDASPPPPRADAGFLGPDAGRPPADEGMGPLPCTPSCSGRQCGADGCGGTCGT
jgi:hypothetical protein